MNKIKKPSNLSPEMLQKAHDYYMEAQSLTQTSEWLEEEHNIRFNRFKLSKQFHRNNYYVQSPNGKPQLDYYQENNFLDEWNSLVADAVELAWKDILDYLNGDGCKTDYMTSCWFISSPLYSSFLERLQNNAFGNNIDSETLPDGVSREDIIRGREMYESGLKYWVLTDGEEY